MPNLSVIVPARNETWLSLTVEDVLANMRGDTEVIVMLDGAWADPPLKQHPRVQVVKLPAAIGQRAATNLGAKISTARYVMKLDAHCSMAEGFDVELIRAAQELGEDVTQVPAQFNFHVFDWMCDVCGIRNYQGPTPGRCYNQGCGSTSFHKEIVWKKRDSRLTTAWRFDHDLHFQYFGEFRHRPEAKADIHDVMSCLGACWFLSRERYWELGGLDEAHGSWGGMGTEIACKAWLSGGRLVVNKRTNFAHLFRTQGGDFGFPYSISGEQQEKAREYSRWLWKGNHWPQAVHSLKWLVEKFAPVPGWTQEQIDGLPGGTVSSSSGRDDLRAAESVPMGDVRHAHNVAGQPVAGLVYFSDCRGDDTILSAVRAQLARCANGHQIVSATLKPLDFGRNIVLPLERGPLTMFRQILAGLEALDTKYAFLTEHDVAYHASHFDFVPPRDDVYYYNVNCWKVDAVTGRAVTYLTKQTSGLCANRQLLIEHYRKRVERVERDGFSRRMGFEPGSHRRAERIDDVPSDVWRSAVPNIDIRHGANLTASRWSPDEFRDKRNCQGWQEADAVPGWGVTRGRFAEFLQEVAHGQPTTA